MALHFATGIASLQHASVAVATLLVCSTPVFTKVWTIVRTRRSRPMALTSIGLAFAGVAVVVGIPNRTETPLGIGLAINGAIAMEVVSRAMALLSQLFGHIALAAAVRTLSATLVATTTLLGPVLAAAIFAERFAF